MADEPEVIKQQMEETRSSLADKLERLEKQVVGAVQTATSAVTDTVSTVKDAVQDTVQTVKGGVEGTVQTVKGSVHGTVHSVRETFDVPLQVQRRPFAMVAGAVAVGFVTGYFLRRPRAHAHPAYYGAAYGHQGSGRSFVGATQGTSGAASSGPASRPWNGLDETSAGQPQAAASAPAPAAPAQPKGPSLVSKLADTFHDEIGQFKSFAIGAALSAVRDLVKDNLPPDLAPRVDEVATNITHKLGGQPIAGRLLAPPARDAGPEGFAASPRAFAASEACRDPQAKNGPRGSPYPAASNLP